MNTTFEFNARDDGHHDGIVQRRDRLEHIWFAIAQVNGDVGIHEIGHG